MGIPPSILWGRDRVSVTRGGTTYAEPDFTTRDYLLLQLLEEWEESLCPGCGRPLTEHTGRTRNDYAAGHIACPALEELEAEQAQKARSSGNENAKPDPLRPLVWSVDLVENIRAREGITPEQ